MLCSLGCYYSSKLVNMIKVVSYQQISTFASSESSQLLQFICKTRHSNYGYGLSLPYLTTQETCLMIMTSIMMPFKLPVIISRKMATLLHRTLFRCKIIVKNCSQIQRPRDNKYKMDFLSK